MKRKRHIILAVAAAILILPPLAALLFSGPAAGSRTCLGAALYAGIALCIAYLLATWPSSVDRESDGDGCR